MTAPAPKSALPERPVARHYSYGEVAVLMAAFVACAALLDSGGLLTWANRLEVGPGQVFWLRVFGPMNEALTRVRLDRPRTALIAEADRFSERFGPQVEAVAQLDPAEPLPTASPAPLSNEIDGPLGKLRLPSGDEVELPGFAVADAEADAPPGPTDVRILLIGDSMMQVGLGPGIVEAFAKDPHVHVLRETHIGTGLSRPDVYDWPATLAPLLFRERPRFVVATFGGNDAQDMRLGGQIISFGTSRWDAAYQDRVHDLLAELTRDGAQVLWVGLPPMRAEDFTERVSKLNDLVVAAAKGMPRVQFLDTTPLLTGEDHAFTTYLPAEGGGLLQVRQEDGIHLSSAGGERVAAQAVRWIDAAAVAEASAALSAPATPARPSGPAPGG